MEKGTRAGDETAEGDGGWARVGRVPIATVTRYISATLPGPLTALSPFFQLRTSMRETLSDNRPSVDDEDHPSTHVSIRSRREGFNRS